MKKLGMFVVGLCLISSFSQAACVLGRFCADDTGASVNGNAFNGNGYVFPVVSSTTIQTIANPVPGDIVVCKSCANAVTTYAVCIATSTVGNPGGFTLLMSSATVACL